MSDYNDERRGARYIGDAQIGPYRTVRHVIDGACYIIAGITGFVVASNGIDSAWLAVVFGIAALCYGLKIILLGGDYWVSSAVYVMVFFAIAIAFGSS